MGNKKSKKSNKKIRAITIITVVIIIVVVIVVGKILKDKKVENPTEESTGGEMLQFESNIDMSDLSNSEIREDGLKINNSTKLQEGYEFNKIKLKDIKIESTGDMATFTAEVTNNLKDDIEGYIIYITFYREDGTKIDTVETFFPDIPAGETSYITATTPKDIATAYSLEIEEREESVE